jgi:hypothetical protein
MEDMNGFACDLLPEGQMPYAVVYLDGSGAVLRQL